MEDTSLSMTGGSAALSFLNRVVVVTGSGNGLGREYALDFARRGAKVVVNDYGGDMLGASRGSATPADKVVGEIRNAGGTAVPNYDSVEQGDKIVQTAISNFGRIDVLVNNAGILRDKSFVKMTDEDWDLINRVHVRGSYITTKAAWPYFRDQKFGRVIFTTSTSGLYGSFGQANYSAAKMGLVGLSNTLATEGAKYNILCNAVAPIAGSRLTQTVMPPDLVNALKPALVAPLVVYLSHDSCNENGSIFETAAGWVAKTQLFKSRGIKLQTPSRDITAESVRDNWGEICDMNPANVTTTSNQQDAMQQLMQILQSDAGGEQKSPVSNDSPAPFVDTTPGRCENPAEFFVTHKDVILYNISVGASVKDTKLVYENEDEFSAVPSFAVIPAQRLIMTPESLQSHPQLADIDFTKVLHGEHYTEIYLPFPTTGKLVSKSEVVEVMDKKSGALALFNVDTFDESGRKVCFNQFGVFIVGHGGFGGPRNSQHHKALGVTPRRSPDVVTREKTGADQAALFRLNGDWNPLHIDPDFAQMGGFSQPILHGMCSFGYATRHIMAAFAGDQPSKIKALKARFTKPILPGETIETRMWLEGSRVHFECTAVESGNVIISGAYADLDKPEKTTSSNQTGLSAVDAVFNEVRTRLAADPTLVKSVNGIFHWIITDDNSSVFSEWTFHFKANEKADIYEGKPKTKKADTVLTVSEKHLLDIFKGSADPQKLFFAGKLKVSGNVMLTQKLNKLFSSNKSKL